MATYHKHMTQRVPSDPYWQYNCTAYAAAMLGNDSVLGGVFGLTGQAIRAYSTEPKPDPDSPGLSIRQVQYVLNREYRINIAERTGQPWSTLMAELNRGRRILLQIEYKTLAGARCQANGDFGHAIVLIRDSGTNTILASDPLCSSAKNYSENLLKAAATAFGQKNGGKLWWAMTRPIPTIR